MLTHYIIIIIIKPSSKLNALNISKKQNAINFLMTFCKHNPTDG